MWDLTTPTDIKELAAPLTGGGGAFYLVAFSPDGHTLATAGDDYTMQLWDITETRRPQRLSEPLSGFTGFLTAVAFSPDGRTVVAGSTDPLHATPIGSPLHSRSSAAQVTFSPDGNLLASGGEDGSVLLWDVRNRDHPAAIGDSLIPSGAASRTRVAFDPHGRLYAASRDGAIRIFNLDTDNTKRIRASTRNVLTEQRWSQVLPDLRYDPPCQRAAE